MPVEVFLSSPWIPAEWIQAHGLVPRALLFAPGFGCGAVPLGAGICAFAERTLQFAETGTRSAVVFSTHCDQLRRACDSISTDGGGRSFLFNLPVTTRQSVVERLFRAELDRLGRFLVSLGGRAPEPQALAWYIRSYEACRDSLRQAAATTLGRQYARALAEFHWHGPGAPSPLLASREPNLGQGVRVALVGGPLGLDHGIWDQLEAAGAEVVLNGTEWGERSLGMHDGRKSLPRPTDPVDSLAGAFLDRCVEVFQRPNQRLYQWLAPKLNDRRVRGIILLHHFGCDLWRAEAQTLREQFNLPLLSLEADESGGAAERNANRIQAFVEAIR